MTTSVSGAARWKMWYAVVLENDMPALMPVSAPMLGLAEAKWRAVAHSSQAQSRSVAKSSRLFVAKGAVVRLRIFRSNTGRAL